MASSKLGDSNSGSFSSTSPDRVVGLVLVSNRLVCAGFEDSSAIGSRASVDAGIGYLGGLGPFSIFSFGPSTVTCPACNGKHRKHTYDEHCNLLQLLLRKCTLRLCTGT